MNEALNPTVRSAFEDMSERARQFERLVRRRITLLSDEELNDFYLLSHTEFNLGCDVELETKIIMPLIADEWERRVLPRLS